MFRHAHFGLRMGIAWLLAIGLLWMPNVALASSGSGCAPMHQIASGENLTLIAKRYEVSVDVLVLENGLDDPNMIAIGQWICIPADKGASYEYEYWGDYGVPGQSYDPSAIDPDAPSQAGAVADTSTVVAVNRGAYRVPQTEPDHPAQNYDDSQADIAEEPIYIVPGRSYAPEVYERGRRYYESYAQEYAQEYAADSVGE